MRILIACEESQRVCEEFRNKGHQAYSCDIMKCSGGHPEWHIKGDVLPLLNGNCEFITMDFKKHLVVGHWDMIIAFPPCTHLAASGAAWFEKKRKNGEQRKAVEFFHKILNADCKRICIENPIGIISGDYVETHFLIPKVKYTQIIQPWQFGDNVGKSTCLWLKGLDPLIPEITERPPVEYHEWTDKNGRKKKDKKCGYIKQDVYHIIKEALSPVKHFQVLHEQWLKHGDRGCNMMYFNVIRNLIRENTHCIFRNGPMVIYDGCELPKDLDELFIVDISTNRCGILIFECC